MGEEPSQHPPDWWKRIAPCSAFSVRRRSSVAAVAVTRGTADDMSEEPELLRAIADQQILGLLIVRQHHLVVLAADARRLVTTERRVGRIRVIAVGPDATS